MRSRNWSSNFNDCKGGKAPLDCFAKGAVRGAGFVPENLILLVLYIDSVYLLKSLISRCFFEIFKTSCTAAQVVVETGYGSTN